MSRVLSLLNLFLVANVFFVLFSFVWLALAVVGRSVNLNLGLDFWYSLWEPVFTPAIGILMGGAFLSGIVSWFKRRMDGGK